MKNTSGLVLAMTLVMMAGVAEAITVSCGQTLGPSTGTLYLENNVGPCDGASAAITLIGPVRLDLNGHTVSCQDTDGDALVPNGIALQGPRALVRNGTVNRCSVGVLVSGDHNRVASVSISDSRRNAILVEGNFNVLTRNFVNTAGAAAVDVSGDRNILHENVVRRGTVAYLVTGDYNNLRGNVGRSSGDGFVISGQRPTLVSNFAMFNFGRGFWILPSGCILHTNGAVLNDREGFFIQSSDCILRGNSSGNNLYGIVVGGFNNAMIGNGAGGNERIDLVDFNGECTSNIWSSNSFGTKDPDCIE